MEHNPPGVWYPSLTTFSTVGIVIATDGDQCFLNSASGFHGTRQPYCALYCTNKDSGILIPVYIFNTNSYLLVCPYTVLAGYHQDLVFTVTRFS